MDPRTAALWRVGVVGQTCYEKHSFGISGKLVLHVALRKDGGIAAVEALAAESTKALLGGDFERCVIDGVRKERFPAQRSDDVELEVPLAFEPAK